MNHQTDPPGTYTGAPQGPPHLQNIPGKETSSTKRHTKEPRLITKCKNHTIQPRKVRVKLAKKNKIIKRSAKALKRGKKDTHSKARRAPNNQSHIQTGQRRNNMRLRETNNTRRPHRCHTQKHQNLQNRWKKMSNMRPELSKPTRPVEG